MSKTEGNIKELSLDEIMETLTEDQARFILHISVVAGHLSRHWLDEAIKLSRSIKP